jgi:hypothetical protein
VRINLVSPLGGSKGDVVDLSCKEYQSGRGTIADEHRPHQVAIRQRAPKIGEKYE